MFEKKLLKLIEEAKNIRRESVENESASYTSDNFDNLSKFITKKLNSPLFKNKNIKIIANHFDEILPFIVSSNIDFLFSNAYLLVEQPNFKEKFIDGIKKYPYKENMDQLFYYVFISLSHKSKNYDVFIDEDILKTISSMNLSSDLYLGVLDWVNEDNQKKFLQILAENKCDIPYSLIKYKGNNEGFIFDNLTLFTENSQNLYALLDFVKNDSKALSHVKEYIDNNGEKALDTILSDFTIKSQYTGEKLLSKDNSSIKEVLRLIILDVMKNEKVNFSDITFSGGGFSRVIFIGDKVIKVGERVTKTFPNNPYIIAPLLRKELEVDEEKCFVEVTERVDTDIEVNQDELYHLYKNIRDLGLVWTDIKKSNVGRLTKKNVIHWRDNIEPSDKVLELDDKRGSDVLEEGSLVILDADFIYDEKDKNIDYTTNSFMHDTFEKRYQNELKQQKQNIDTNIILEENVTNNDMVENEGMHR